MKKTLWIVLIAAAVALAGTGTLVYAFRSAGEPSGMETSGDYITEAAAKEIALNHAGVSESELTYLHVEFDKEFVGSEYDIDFRVGAHEYEYEINAKTGEITSRDHDIDDDHRTETAKPETSADTSAPMTDEKPPVTDDNSTPPEVSAEESADVSAPVTDEKPPVTDDKPPVTDEKPPVTDDKPPVTDDNSKQETVTPALLTEKEVLDIVWAHAKGKAETYKIELDRDDGRWEYDVEFVLPYSGTDPQGREVFGVIEYAYEVNAETGEIVKFKDKTVITAVNTEITEEAAKATVLAHAKVTESEISGFRMELDRDDGVLCYEIEFRVGNTEYEYEVDATTGKIVDFEIDRD